MQKRFFVVLVAVILTGVFAACDKDSSDGGSSDGNGGGGGSASVIEVKKVENVYDDVATVKAVIGPYGNLYTCGTSKFEKNGFKINLSANVPEQYLLNSQVMEIFNDYGVASDESALLEIAGIWAYDNKGEDLGDFYYRGESEKFSYDAYYVYASKEFTAKGEANGGTIDCSFKKGWNILYYYADDKGEEYGMTTTKPAGATFKWYYSSDAKSKSLRRVHEDRRK